MRHVLILGLVLLAGPVAAQDQPRPQPDRVPSLGGRTFPSGQVEREVRPQDGAAAARDRQQLRELNDLSRQLTPPGTPVPAPHVEPPQRRN